MIKGWTRRHESATKKVGHSLTEGEKEARSSPEAKGRRERVGGGPSVDLPLLKGKGGKNPAVAPAASTKKGKKKEEGRAHRGVRQELFTRKEGSGLALGKGGMAGPWLVGERGWGGGWWVFPSLSRPERGKKETSSFSIRRQARKKTDEGTATAGLTISQRCVLRPPRGKGLTAAVTP